MLIIVLLARGNAKGQEPIVSTDHPLYSYAELMQDLEGLRTRYPDIVRCELRGRTSEGRLIPLVRFGSPRARRFIMVQAAMHAREYMSAQLVMAMLEHYALHYQSPWWRSASGSEECDTVVRLSDLFADVGLVVLPMVNPDGVMIAQQGASAALTPSAREWVLREEAAGGRHDQLKANARGVDLNRNFACGFNCGRWTRMVPGFDFYSGPSPLSEPETQTMMDVAGERDYACFLNYHTSGHNIFYGCLTAPDSVNAKAALMARVVRRHTGFTLYGPATAAPGGTWADEVETRFQRPSATIECGSRNPVPIEEFGSQLMKNLWVWAELADLVRRGVL